MDFQNFFFQEAALIIAIIGGLGGVIVFMLSKRLSHIDQKIDKVETDLKEEIREVERNQKEFEKETTLTHKELYELTKKIEIQYSKLESKIDLIGRKVCKGNWE